MEALYLIGSIASSTLISAVLSLRLLLSCLASRLRRAPVADLQPGNGDDVAALRLYEGRVKHARRSPRHHAFEYTVRYAFLDLDRAGSSENSNLPSSLFPKSFFAGHLSSDEARAIASTDGPVWLLTIPPSVGYEQNPLSIYFCYDRAEDTGQPASSTEKPCLRKCIAEVTNTPWGERVLFVFDPKSDLVAKPLHVSPFMDMLGSWKMHVGEPGEKLYVGISVQHPEMGNYFTATLSATRVSPSSQVNPEAVKLWWKDVRFIQHPRYSNPEYREEARRRDQKLSCPLIGVKGGGSRWFLWKEAAWPWC
ncbi:DUF1365 family protein isoform X2 [Wolffia australiana]